ncbi:MAG TPA: DUF1876 domain-containing protein [Micromonosporaceae bacterium]|jgi:hypothetical protein
MTETKRWTVEIVIDEHEDELRTHARARLQAGDRGALLGEGMARRNPADRDVPEIGDELAVARALSDLAHNLLDTAAGDIETITSRPAHLST